MPCSLARSSEITAPPAAGRTAATTNGRPLTTSPSSQAWGAQNVTHRALAARCENFNRPLDRYSSRHKKLQQVAEQHFHGAAMTLRRFDGTVIDPDQYSPSQMLDDLRSIEQLRPIVDGLEGLTFPDPDEEQVYTKRMTKRGRKPAAA